MNDEIKISEEAREAAQQFVDSTEFRTYTWTENDLALMFQRFADEQVKKVDTARRAFIAELESVLAQRDNQVNGLERIIEKGIHIGYGAAVTAEIERQQAMLAQRDQRIAELTAALRCAINTVECDSLDASGNELPWYKQTKKALGEKTV